MKVPEKHRVKKGVLASDASYGNNGMFVVPHYKIDDYHITCQASDQMFWDHVSVTIGSKKRKVERCPTWEEMCYIKDLFWDKNETVIQIHPPETEYVNQHKYCLHLWKSQTMDVPLPDSIMVGEK